MAHFRIVLFDNLSFGMNSRLAQSSASRQDCQEIDAWLTEYWERWVEACGDLPPKFLLAGHSFGAYQAALYASKHPDRVSKFFAISPANF